ncbi:MAG TPA: hypothetical protein VKA70_18000 [Blastocatellia bacterium]|nr:hypothetical protein [Blastocatellia bacterium]
METRRDYKTNSTLMRRSLLLAVVAAAFALLSLAPYGLVGAQDGGATDNGNTIQFDLVPAADVIANCFPDARAKVTILLRADEAGTDTFTLTAKRFRPDTTFAVFLTELPAAPFGAVEYLGDLTTNAGGRGSLQVNAIIEEAFVSQAINGQRVRKDLNHVVLWFADPADAGECFAPAAVPNTPFDGDGVAGPAALSSRNALPGAPLP